MMTLTDCDPLERVVPSPIIPRLIEVGRVKLLRVAELIEIVVGAPVAIGLGYGLRRFWSRPLKCVRRAC
jgi:hypothetical protein